MSILQRIKQKVIDGYFLEAVVTFRNDGKLFTDVTQN